MEQQENPLLELYEWLESGIVTVVGMLLLFTLIVRPATVNGPSMMKTLHDGDRLILQQAGYHDPQYGDIVVIDRTGTGEPAIVKRVIGRAGDTIDIDFTAHTVRRNGELLDEPYVNEPTELGYDVEFPVRVPEGCIFVLGDNRNNSLDSRASEIGMVDVRRVMGKAVFRFFPFGKIGGVS